MYTQVLTFIHSLVNNHDKRSDTFDFFSQADFQRSHGMYCAPNLRGFSTRHSLSISSYWNPAIERLSGSTINMAAHTRIKYALRFSDCHYVPTDVIGYVHDLATCSMTYTNKKWPARWYAGKRQWKWPQLRPLSHLHIVISSFLKDFPEDDKWRWTVFKTDWISITCE